MVFDCDGVLVNTEELGWEVWRSLSASYGISLALEDLRAITGCTDAASVAYFEKWLNEDDLAVLGPRFAEAIAVAKRERTESYVDARGTLRSLRSNGWRVAVASNSTTVQVERALDRGELTAFVDVVIGFDQVAAPKPAPDLYHEAHKRLGCSAVVAVEDSPTGIASAVAAGLPVLAVDRGIFARSQLTEATTIESRISYEALASLVS